MSQWFCYRPALGAGGQESGVGRPAGAGHPPVAVDRKLETKLDLSDLEPERVAVINNKERGTMSDGEVVANQKTILRHQASILENQKTILKNQATIKKNQSALEEILANQKEILKNQKQILAGSRKS